MVDIVYFCNMIRTFLLLICCLGISLRAQTVTLRPGEDVESYFTSDTLSDALFRTMTESSYRHRPPVTRSELRYLRVLHHDGHGHVRVGEMVCHRAIARDLLEIFRELYKASYPIERMELVDRYGGDDERSMSANNTSCFNHRPVTGRKVTLSRHAYGMAVDINPLYNPYCKQRADGSWKVSPATATKYRNRVAQFPYKITRGDLLYRLFIQHGFTWGGGWKSCKDYQHFEK